MEKVNLGNGNPILQKEYSIAPHMYDSAFKDYQRKFNYPLNYIISAVCGILAILGIILVATGKSPALIVLSVLCIAVIVFVWVHTSSVRKKFVQNIAQVKDERQTAQFFDEGIIITKIPKGHTEGEKNVIKFSNGDIKILDKRYYYIVIVGKSCFHIIPKKVFDSNEENMITKCFVKKLDKNYIQ